MSFQKGSAVWNFFHRCWPYTESDADFFFGPKTAMGGDTYVLCEINVSSTFAFPEVAMPGVARAALERVRER